MDKFRIYAFADEASASIPAQVTAMLKNGLNGLEIRNVDGENVSVISIEKAKEVNKLLKDNGLITWSIGSPIGKIGINDAYEPHLDTFRHTLDVAHALECCNLRMFSFFMPKDEDPAQYRNKVMDRLAKMVEIAEGSGVKLCHENEKGIYGDNAARCREILDAFPQMGGIFDPANFVQVGQETLAAWELLKDRICYMHIKDALADGKVVPAGCGIGNVPAIAKAFIAQGGRDFTMEPHLKVFSGLAALEREGDTSEVGSVYTYESNEIAFDAACEAFRNILKEA